MLEGMTRLSGNGWRCEVTHVPEVFLAKLASQCELWVHIGLFSDQRRHPDKYLATLRMGKKKTVDVVPGHRSQLCLETCYNVTSVMI